MQRVGLSVTLCLCCVVGLARSEAHAQAGQWPVKPVRLIVASPQGSGDDFIARIIAPKLHEVLGQPWVVDNRGGAGGLAGQMLALKAPADGYTFLLAGGSMAGAKYANAHATYDLLRDFTPVSLIETSAFVLVVHPGVPAQNLKQYIALVRSQPPESMTFGTTGPGQIPYWSARLFNDMAGIKAREIPYRGTNEIAIEVMTNRISYFFAPSSLAAIHRDKLRALGVTTPTRSPAFPDVPTIAEAALPGYELPAWRSIMGPRGISRDIVASLNAATARVLSTPDVRRQFQLGGSEPSPSTPAELAKRYAEWIERFGKIAKQAGLKPQ
jgi:tripartite-type tricarboxylate transporter receptor subunit TctC